MKRIILFSAVFALLALGWSCVKEPNIGATLPDAGSVWEELMLVPMKNGGLEKKTFRQLDSLQRDTLVYRCERIVFVSKSEMRIEVRYGDGRVKPGSDSLRCNPALRPWSDYIVATFTGPSGEDKTIQYLDANCSFRGEDYVSAPAPCASQGSFTTRYDFSYENEGKTLLRMGYTYQGRTNVLELIKQ